MINKPRLIFGHAPLHFASVQQDFSESVNQPLHTKGRDICAHVELWVRNIFIWPFIFLPSDCLKQSLSSLVRVHNRASSVRFSLRGFVWETTTGRMPLASWHLDSHNNSPGKEKWVQLGWDNSRFNVSTRLGTSRFNLSTRLGTSRFDEALQYPVID